MMSSIPGAVLVEHATRGARTWLEAALDSGSGHNRNHNCR
jgi:hypothetical protein